jgi:glycopeptide antibiotics resistance protein
VLFELGQRHAIAASQMVPTWFGQVFILENMQNYFLKGTFDFYDLLASFVGAAAAYCVLLLTIQNRRE